MRTDFAFFATLLLHKRLLLFNPTCGGSTSCANNIQIVVLATTIHGCRWSDEYNSFATVVVKEPTYFGGEDGCDTTPNIQYQRL